ncbi:MAG: DUF4397 domain-containing protein [Ferruginibacter sp.]
MTKKFFNIIAVAAVLLATGCKKDDSYKANFTTYSSGDDALLKFIYASAYPANPSVQLSIDDVRVSSLITGRTPFPGGGYNTNGANWPDYLRVEPGTRNVKVSIPKKNTNVDSVVLFTSDITVAAGVRHTASIMDTFTKTKIVVVEDNISKPAANRIRYRFVNLIPNSNPLNLYYGGVLMATGIAYNTPGVVFEMPVPAINTSSWTIREVGGTTDLATYASVNTLTTQRVFTAFAMGYKGSSVTATRPYISFSINL